MKQKISNNKNSETTDIKAAKTFTVEFPLMTFEKAKKAFDILTKETQKQVWINLAPLEKATDRLLPLALHLTILPQELQYAILSQDFSNTADIPTIINSRSIYEHFWWFAMIDKRCGDKNYFHTPRQYQKPYIELTKQELFQLNWNKTKVIQKLDNCLKKNELLFFAQLPAPLLKKIYSNYSAIHFCYQNKQSLHQQCIAILKDALDSCKKILPPILLPLLYSHFVTIPSWNCVAPTQDPIALQIKNKLEETNCIINDLNKANYTPIPISKHTIHPVPYTYSTTDALYMYAPIIIPSSAMYLHENHGKNLYKNKLDTAAELIIANCLGSIASLMCAFGSKIVFNHSVPMGLAGLTSLAGAYGIIKGRIKASGWKCGIVNFKSNETVDQYLNDPTIEIKDF